MRMYTSKSYDQVHITTHLCSFHDAWIHVLYHCHWSTMWLVIMYLRGDVDRLAEKPVRSVLASKGLYTLLWKLNNSFSFQPHLLCLGPWSPASPLKVYLVMMLNHLATSALSICGQNELEHVCYGPCKMCNNVGTHVVKTFGSWANTWLHHAFLSAGVPSWQDYSLLKTMLMTHTQNQLSMMSWAVWYLPCGPSCVLQTSYLWQL